MPKVHIGLIGCGTVGAGVARILLHNQDVLEARVGAELNLKSVADLDIETDRGVAFAPGVLTTDAMAVVNDPQIDIIVEMIGGETFAKDVILAAVANGKPVVTANKALLAKHGDGIFAAASEKGVDVAFEASIGGCMPIVKTLRESLVGDRVRSMVGILNGTCNYILSKITDEGIPIETALADAQQNGYAETDPTLDVEGIDAAHKLTLLSSLAFGMQLDFDSLYIEGIQGISPMDIEYATAFGYRIKLLAISKLRQNGVEARIHPAMIPVGDLLSNVNGSLNAIMIHADAVGDMLLYGHGAGMMPTASAVVGDIVDIARNLMNRSPGRVPLLGYQTENVRRIPIIAIDDIVLHYYIRFSALDRPGVLSRISGVLGNYGISIQSVHQKGRKTNGAVPLVMLTHRSREADIKAALAEIQQMAVIKERPVLIRIEEKNSVD